MFNRKRLGTGRLTSAAILVIRLVCLLLPASAVSLPLAILPLRINGKPSGEVQAVMDEGDVTAIEASTLMSALADRLSADAVKRIEELSGDQEHIEVRSLRELGFEVTFDPGAVVLMMRLPGEMMEPVVHDLYGATIAPAIKLASDLGPSRISGALDAYAFQDWRDGGRQDFRADFDGHINLESWVLQSRMRVLEGDPGLLQRGETVLVKDWEQLPVRQSIGDMSYPVRGLMGFRNLTGAAFTTRFDLQPYEAFFPVSVGDVYLEDDSRVEVYVDGSLRQTLDLAAGPNRLVDLPVNDGFSDVRLQITDRLGRTRNVDFVAMRDDRLLAAGQQEYSIAAGVERELSIDGGMGYDPDGAALSGFYRQGVSGSLSLGGHLEVDRNLGMAGGSGEWQTRVGRLGYDLGVSYDARDGGRTGSALQLTHFFRAAPWATSAGVTVQSPDFANLHQPAEADNRAYWAFLAVTVPRVLGWSPTLRLSADRSWDGRDRTGQGLLLSRAIGATWYASADIGHTYDERSGSEVAARLQLTWYPSLNWRGGMRYDSRRNSTIAELQHRRRGELGWDARVATDVSPSQQTFRGDAGYVSSLLEARVDASNTSGDRVDGHRQAIRVGTGLAFADGQFAITRPLRGQPFAIVKARGDLGGEPVGVTRGNGGTPIAYLGRLGRAVVPDLSPYFIKDVGVRTQDLPMEIDIERDHFRVRPTYRSGTLIEVGADTAIYLRGRLTGAGGGPVGLMMGTFTAAGSDGTVVEFFTDRDGRFEASGVAPGEHEITISQKALYGRIQVPAGTEGIHDVGTVQMTPDADRKRQTR